MEFWNTLRQLSDHDQQALHSQNSFLTAFITLYLYPVFRFPTIVISTLLCRLFANVLVAQKDENVRGLVVVRGNKSRRGNGIIILKANEIWYV